MDALENVSDHFKAYRKADIPDDLHYKKNDRIPEIVILVQDGWVLKEVSIVYIYNAYSYQNLTKGLSRIQGQNSIF